MFGIELAYPFSLGLFAAFNPCGFAMLPVYVSFFLGQNSDADTSRSRSILRAVKVAGTLTLGFVLVFGLFGVLTASVSGAIKPNLPYVVMVLGVLFVPLGIAMLRGFEPKLKLPRMQKGGDSGDMWSMFLFGVSYAVVSLSCTIGPFVATSSGALTTDNFFEGVSVFLAYGLGMGAVITTLTIGLAMARTSIATNMRRVLPWVNRVSGVFLLLSGIYLVVYGWWEYQVLIRRNASENAVVTFFQGFENEVKGWVLETGAARLGVGMLILVSAVLLRALWSDMSQRRRIAGAGAIGLAWVIAEFAWQKADLFILPTIRTIGDIPMRLGNWFTDPFRWAVLGELFVVAIIGLSIWFRVRRMRAPDVADEIQTPTPVGAA